MIMLLDIYIKQIQLLTEFLGYFMKPQLIPKTSRKLKQIELSDVLLMPKSDMLAEKNCDKKGDQRLCREGSYK